MDDTTVQTPDQNPSIMTSQMPSSMPDLSALSGQQPTVNAAPNPADNDPEIQAAAVHHGRVAQSLNAIAQILGGGGGGYRLNKNSDGSVSIEQYDPTPGQRWGRIAATALAGAAKGFAAGQGPGGMGRAAGAGMDTGFQTAQNQQDRTMAMAKQMNDQNRADQLFKANMAKLNQDAIKSTWEMQRDKNTALENEEDRQAAIQTHMQAANAKKFHVGGSDPDQLMDDVAKQYNSNQELQQAHHDGRTVVYTTHDPKTGAVTGADIYMVPEDEMEKPYMQDYQRTELQWDNDHPENKPKEVNIGTPIKAGSMKTKDVVAMQQADLNQRNNTTQAWNKYEGDIAQQKAQDEQTRAQAALASAQNRAAAAADREKFTPTEVTMPDGSKQTMAVGDRGTLKPYEGLQTGATLGKPGAADAAAAKVRQYVDKNYVLPARDAEKASDLFADAYQDHLKGVTTGAPSMLALSQHLTTTFGNVKGARVTRDMIHEHLGARSITDDALTAVQRLTNGDVLSNKQWDAFKELIGNARSESWRRASDAALSMDYDPNHFLPANLKNTDVARGYQGPATPAPGQGGLSANTSQAARAPGQAYNPTGQYDPNKTYNVQSGGKTFPVLGSKLATAYQRDKNIQIMGAQ